mmetsp:Transcript_33382/g.66429  ORF Transcript_33382/g.66429 Transcript_33382/m.66429 type:complete len:227 (-) Transcript_33382:697-1377(-)
MDGVTLGLQELRSRRRGAIYSTNGTNRFSAVCSRTWTRTTARPSGRRLTRLRINVRPWARLKSSWASSSSTKARLWCARRSWRGCRTPNSLQPLSICSSPRRHRRRLMGLRRRPRRWRRMRSTTLRSPYPPSRALRHASWGLTRRSRAASPSCSSTRLARSSRSTWACSTSRTSRSQMARAAWSCSVCFTRCFRRGLITCTWSPSLATGDSAMRSRTCCAPRLRWC